MILVRMNHRELTTESKRTKLSIIRFLQVLVEKLCQRSFIYYLTTLFQQNLIVFAEGDTEDNGSHILKAMNPFLPFTSLASHIEHAIVLSVRA